MRMLDAAKATVALAVERGYAEIRSDEDNMQSLSYNHIIEMLSKMETTPMSDAKMGRWLGWLQAACVYGTGGAVSLDDCKRINMEHADDHHD